MFTQRLFNQTIIIVMFIVLAASSSFAQDCWRVGGDMYCPDIDSTMFTIVFKDSTDPWTPGAKSMPGFLDSTSGYPTGAGSWTYSLAPDYPGTYEQARTTLENNEDVALTNPVMLGLYGEPITISNQAEVRFGDDVSYSMISSILNEYNLDQRSMDSIDYRHRYISATDSTPVNNLFELGQIFEDEGWINYDQNGYYDVNYFGGFYPCIVLEPPPPLGGEGAPSGVDYQSDSRSGDTINDPYFPLQWGLNNTYNEDADVQYNEGMEIFTPTSGPDSIVTIAVLLPGIEYGHPDIDDVVRYKNGYASAGDDLTDPHNLTHSDLSDVEVGPLETWPDSNRYTRAYGMHVLGAMIATVNNLEGLTGVASSSIRIIPIRIQDKKGMVSHESFTLGLDAASFMAFGGGVDMVYNPYKQAFMSNATSRAVASAKKYGNVIFTPVGNNAGVSNAFSNLEDVIGVGGYDITGDKNPWSNMGEGVFVMGPIRGYSTDLMGDAGVVPIKESCDPEFNYHCNFYSTGYSGALITAMYANALVQNPIAQNPGGDGAMVYGQSPIDYAKEALQKSSVDIETPGWDPKSGYGRSHFDMLLKVVGGDPDGSGELDIDDVVYLINYIFGGGPAPVQGLWAGDMDCSGAIDIDDVVYLINYIFGDGPAPVSPCDKWL